MKALILLVSLLFSTTVFAGNLLINNITELEHSVMSEAKIQGLNWTVGDYADYKLNAGFIPGKIHSVVREETSEGYWVQQDVDMMIQKQKIEILFDKNTGQVKKILVDGKEQQQPDQGDAEVVDIREENITVAAGTFDCMYVKMKNNRDNTEQQAWLNPELIPISGLILMKSPSQMGEVTMELTGYKKQ